MKNDFATINREKQRIKNYKRSKSNVYYEKKSLISPLSLASSIALPTIAAVMFIGTSMGFGFDFSKLNRNKLNLESRINIENSISNQIQVPKQEVQETISNNTNNVELNLDESNSAISGFENITTSQPEIGTYVNKEYNYVQLGSYLKPENIEFLKQKFKGLDYLIEQVNTYDGKTVSRFYVNCYDDPKFLDWFIGNYKIKKDFPIYRVEKKSVPVLQYSHLEKIQLIRDYCKKVGFDSNIALAIWDAETEKGQAQFGFYLVYDEEKQKLVRDRKRKGHYILTAVGDFQLNPKYHGKVEELTDFETNMKKAVSHMKYLHQLSNGDLDLLARMYNAGEVGDLYAPEPSRHANKVLSTYQNLVKKKKNIQVASYRS